MRGKVPRIWQKIQVNRITPAYAGKSCSSLPLVVRCGDHPRICGEKLAMLLLLVQFLGSPPHMRGKDGKDNNSPQAFGITPAYAGKSGCGPVQAFRFQDHPRICGEKSNDFRVFRDFVGSPPHMRGKAGQTDRDRAGGRITPAYAGKSCPKRPCCGHRWDHPRICGEKTKKIP